METSLKQEILELAKDAAIKAGEIHLKHYGKKKEISHKLNQFDLVTNVDKESESVIIDTIKAKYPGHNIIAEESDSIKRGSDFQWVIDPLDGTTNYAHNFPHFCTSIALMYKGELTIGVVYDVIKKELFYAAKGMGAYLNEDKLQVSDAKTLEESLLATGFPYDRSSETFVNLDYFENLSYKSQAIRRPGSAALDLCYVACARLDGFWELMLSPWDTAAGAVIVREAGGIVTNFYEKDFDIFVKSVIASNPDIYDEITSVLKETDAKSGK